MPPSLRPGASVSPGSRTWGCATAAGEVGERGAVVEVEEARKDAPDVHTLSATTHLVGKRAGLRQPVAACKGSLGVRGGVEAKARGGPSGVACDAAKRRALVLGHCRQGPAEVGALEQLLLRFPRPAVGHVDLGRQVGEVAVPGRAWGGGGGEKSRDQGRERSGCAFD